MSQVPVASGDDSVNDKCSATGWFIAMVIFAGSFTIQANKHGGNGGRIMRKKYTGTDSPLIEMAAFVAKRLQDGKGYLCDHHHHRRPAVFLLP